MSLNGRKSDYLYIKSGQLFKCACCHKKFLMTSDHIFKRPNGSGKKFFCSYSCMKKWERNQADRDRKTVRSDSGIKMSLESWANLYELDYYEFWEKVMVNKLRPKDAAMVLLN